MDIKKVTQLKNLVFEASFKIKPFARFLKEHNIRTQYIRNHFEVINKLHQGKYNAYFFPVEWNVYLLRSIIDTAFVWRDTPEGYTFWSSLDKAWSAEVDAMTAEEKNELNEIVLELKREKY